MESKRNYYMSLLDEGLSYAEIATKCGVSRQTVYSSVGRYSRKTKPRREKRYNKGIENQVIYTGVADYLIDQEMSVSGLARRCGMSPATMLRLMRGDQDLKQSHIDAIISVTGLTYEQLFKEEG